MHSNQSTQRQTDRQTDPVLIRSTSEDTKKPDEINKHEQINDTYYNQNLRK